MANVSNSISLQDKMTPVLSQIIRSLDATLKAMKSVNAESSKGAQAKAFGAANNAIKQAKNSLDGMVGEMKKAKDAGADVGVSIKSWQGNLMGAQAALQLFNAGLSGAKKVLDIVKQFNEAAYADDAAQTRLASQLRNVVKTREEGIRAQQEINRIAQDGERKTVVAGTATIAGASQLATYGLQEQSIRKLLPALQDLSVGMYGVNVREEQMMATAQLFGKVLNGQTAALSRYGIQMTAAQKKILETGKEAQKTEVLVQLLGKAYGGLAENMAQSSAGARVQFQNQWSHMMEEVGATTANAMTSIYKSLSQELPRIQVMVQQLFDMLVPAIEWVANTGIPMVVDALEFLMPILMGIVDFIKNNWKEIRKIMSLVTLGLSDIVLKLIDLWQRNRDTGGEIVKQWYRVKDTIVDVAIAIKMAVMSAFQTMINFAIDQINRLIDLVNKIPGVNIGKIENAAFADKMAEQEMEKAQQRFRDRQARDAELNKFYEDVGARVRFGSGQSGADALWGSFNGKINVGTVEQIKDSVSINADDLKFMKDVAMKDFDVRMQQVTPMLTISNMNVSETADVEQVADALEKVVAEAANSDINVGIANVN